MARVLIGNVKPVKGVDYMTSEDIAELGKYFAPIGYVSSQHTVSAVGELDVILGDVYSAMADRTQKVINVALYVYDGLPGGNWFITLRKTSIAYGSAEAILYSASGAGPQVYRRNFFERIWGTWACENPPMEPGVEYLITERWFNKPVYTTLISFGSLATTSETRTTTFTADRVVRSCGHIGGACLPIINGTLENQDSAWSNSFVSDGVVGASISCGSRMVGKSAQVQLWYTKP